MLSICVCTRNDNYGGNLLSRIQTWLTGLVLYREKYDWDIEVNFVEWNPISGKSLLHDILDYPNEFPIHFYIVPNKVHAQFPNRRKVQVFGHIGKNVGIRQSRGDWVLTTNVDLLYSDYLVDFLRAERLEEGAFYRVTRYDINERRVPPGSIEKQLAFCERHVTLARRSGFELLHTRACGDFILMSCKRWLSFRGFPEWPIYDIYFDGLAMCSAYVTGMRQIVLNRARIYHINHHRAVPEPALNCQSQYVPIRDKILATRRSLSLEINPENWGLGDCLIQQVRPHLFELSRGEYQKYDWLQSIREWGG